MAITTRNKRNASFSMASMSDLVFLLLIFFMLTSTLVAPNAVKLLLPTSSSKTMARQTITVYIDPDYDFYVEGIPVSANRLESAIKNALGSEMEGSVVLRADKTVAVQYIVDVIDAVNEINRKGEHKHKVILATKPPNR